MTPINTRVRAQKGGSQPTVPNCPTTSVRWLALLPDPVTGLDAPVQGSNHEPLTLSAPNREYAIRLFGQQLTRSQMRLVSVVSVVDWQARAAVPQRSKLSREGGCIVCGSGATNRHSRYCAEHRGKQQRRMVNRRRTA